ncbi:aminotransferase class III-fold pyridoxal phosphate-dependent enzyme [Bradyrhizobium sp. 17]|nr:aminotransferase class III-fold pyridoxal phosphate-dependent enzyme [Bradyrhizobium sp. 17]
MPPVNPNCIHPHLRPLSFLDVDGHEYRDFVCEMTAGIYGHSHPVIREAVMRRLDLGWSLGGHTSLEGELAELLAGLFSSIERVRFVNSGTEANMFSIQLARIVTNRSAVLGFDGCYHGGLLGFSAKPNPLTIPFVKKSGDALAEICAIRTLPSTLSRPAFRDGVRSPTAASAPTTVSFVRRKNSFLGASALAREIQESGASVLTTERFQRVAGRQS